LDKVQLVYEGKAKIVYSTEDPDKLIIEFKDDATAFDGVKKAKIANKGYYNAQISATLFKFLEDSDIPTHFIKLISDRDMLTWKLKILLVEVVMRNVVAGSLSKRLGLEEGTALSEPILEFYYKSDELHDPMINEYHIKALNLATPEMMKQVAELSFAINDKLKDRFDQAGLRLIDFKLEFGVFKDKVILGDEISPDTCRFWDKETNEKLDKDRFRRDLGRIEEAYEEVYKRVVLDEYSP